MIELLIVMGILTVLVSITLIAVNPLESINKARDVASKSIAKDFVSSTNAYFASQKTLPWEKNISCRNELKQETTLSKITSCVGEITEQSQIGTKYTSADEAKDVYVTECSGAIAVCYHPKSKALSNEGDARYAKNGVLQPGCPGGSECYSCNFSSNDAQECFQTLSPNGSLSMIPSSSPGSPLPIPNRSSINTCSDPSSGQVSCMAKVVTSTSGTPFSSIAPPAGFGPDQIHTAYNLPCTPGGVVSSKCSTPAIFGPKILAVILAYHAPNIESDLAVYNETYGLPPCTKANGCLTVVNQNGSTSPVPATDASWALEASLDVQMSHAVCQTCKILLVEANSNYFSDISVAVNRAASMGATAISNSYGAGEWSGETVFDSTYSHPNTFITASSGDWGYGTYYPAASKNVIAVGGTTLSLFSDNSYSSESVWSGAGSGCSSYQTANTFQTNASNWNLTGCASKRGISDVSAVANPSTGVAVYDTTSYSGKTGWWILGGTSVSSPIVAAALALSANPPSGMDSASYIYSNPSKFRDVTIGTNGSCGGTTACKAGVGYDGPTGMGSPNFSANNVTSAPTATPTLTPTPTPTNTPTPTPAQAPRNYALDDTKLLATYAMFTFPDPTQITINNWLIDVSFRPDFAGTISEQKYNPTLYYLPDNGDTILNAAPGGERNYCFGTSVSPAYTVCRTITSKYIAYMSQPYLWKSYIQGCGRTLYWRIVSYDRTQIGPTYSNTIDCATTVGVIDPPLSWYTVFDQAYTQKQKYYEPLWDADNSGVIDYKDYVIMALKTKARAGGWVPPEILVSQGGTQSPTPTSIGGPGSGSSGSATPTPIPTSTPTPTQAPLNCSTQQTVSLAPTSTVLALPGDTVNYTLTILSNDSVGCSSQYTISQGFPTGWTVSGVPASFTLAGGATKTILLTVKIPTPFTAGNQTVQFWVFKQGQTSASPVNGNIQVAQVGPTNTPTPTPVNCFQGWSQSLGSVSMSGNAGDTVNETLTVTNNNPASCGSAQFVISYGYPSGWIINGLMPPSVTLGGGESKTFQIPVTISTGAQVQDYLLQFWVNNGSNNMNATVHVLALAQPPVTQMFSNQNAKMYNSYVLFEHSYNATGPVSTRVDVATDPALLNQTSGSSPNARYYFASSSGYPMDPSNKATPSTVEGSINSSPQSWSGWKCGATIYYRMYNSGDLRIMSPIQSGVVDCTTVVDVLPWSPWYAAIYQGVYDARYDADHNNKIDYADYWMLVRATRLR